MPDNILSNLQRRLRERMNDAADHLAGGGCKTFDEYQKMVGIIEGLALAERDLLDCVEDEKKAVEEVFEGEQDVK